MAVVQVSKDIGMPVVYVFRQFTDLEHNAGLVSAIKKIELLTSGSVGLGTRWRETREVLGRPGDAEMEMTSFETNRTYTITHHKAGIRIDATFSFRPIPGGTRVTVDYELSSGGVPPGLLEPLARAIRSDVEQALQRDLADLKYKLEH
jgi:hypothetical protein